jgi:uncharacterized protein DUF1501
MSGINRRDWLRLGAAGVCSAFLPPGSAFAQAPVAKAKRVVYLFQAGGPSQLESFDPKPGLAALRGTELPASVRGDTRITTMTSGQGRLNVVNALVQFAQHGQSGLWVSELFPHLAAVADQLCMIKTMQSDAINHDPATNLALTGSQLAGKPSIGAWVSYALNSLNPNLPSFVSMTSDSKVEFVQPLTKRLWGSAFLPVIHQGVALRPGAEPVLYLDDGIGLPELDSRQLFQATVALNQEHFQSAGDPDILQRNQAYDIAANMRTSMRELADVSGEPAEVFELYGPNARVPGSFAANCLRARRLLERDVRFVLLMHRGWDHHYEVTRHMRTVASDVDQPTAALITDLQRLGLMEDTLLVWGGEFGRTAYSQGEITATDHGRDHHPSCFPTFLAGAGVRAGMSFGETDDFSYNVVKDKVHIHDLHATILHLLGQDQNRLTYRHDGRDHRLTDLGGRIVSEILT